MSAQIFGGCMRLYPASHPTPGPRWHVDSDHHTIGIDPTVQPTIDESGFINFYMLEHNPIISGTVAADESLTGKGISGGISNGTSLVRIRLHRIGVGALDLNEPAHWDLVAGPYNNLWITLIHNVPSPAAA